MKLVSCRIINNEVLMSMIATISSDRKKSKEVDNKIEYYKLQDTSNKSMIIALEDKIKMLESKIKLLDRKNILE
jgi:acetolactate synthase small subunit